MGGGCGCTLHSEPCCNVCCAVLCSCRPGEGRSLHLVGVTLLLPEPELEYIKAFAHVNNDFVVEMSGSADTSVLGRCTATGPPSTAMLPGYALGCRRRFTDSRLRQQVAAS